MARNLRKFATVADYQSAQLIKPAVSLIEATDVVFFDQKEVVPTFGGLTVKYNIEDPTVEVQLFNGGGSSTSESSSESGSGGGGGALPTRMIVDGVEETPINTWRFETAGEHIVQYEFENNEISVYFENIDIITNVIFGNSITEIPYFAGVATIFGSCTSLSSVTIGNSVTSIGYMAFRDCSSLTSITCLALEPPVLNGGVFVNTNNCQIYVPASAVDVYKESTSTGWSEYASRIQAIQ